MDRVFGWTHAFANLGAIPRGEVAGSYANSAFNFSRNCHTGFQGGCTILFPSPVYGVSNCFTSLSTLIVCPFLCFLIAILLSVGRLFMCLWAMCIFICFEETPLYFKIVLFFFLLLGWKHSFILWIKIPYQI